MSYGTLTLYKPNGKTAVVDLSVSEVVLGRSRQATVYIDDDLVSKQHVRVTVKPDGVWLEDLAATNGTFVDGSQIAPHQPVRIQPGQSVQMGDTVFQYAPSPVGFKAVEGVPAAPENVATETQTAVEPAWRKPLIFGIAGLMILLLCGLLTFLGWWLLNGPRLNAGTPANGVPILGGISLAACNEPLMTAVSPENAAYQSIPLLDLPFAYGNDVAAFRHAVQRTQAGGRINAFYDHLYPLYASPLHSGVAYGLEPAEPSIGNYILLFNGELNNHDAFSGHPGFDFAPDDPRQTTTAVLAAAAGVISEVDVDESGAYYVKLAHILENVGTFQTIYWHLAPDSFFATTRSQIGQVVPAGTRLGTMDNSGWGVGRQLHFEVRFDWDQNGRFTLDEAIDPFAFLPSSSYPHDPWSQDSTFTDGRGEPYNHAEIPSLYLWRYVNGIQAQVAEDGNGAIAGQAETGLNAMSLCAPAGSLPAGGTVTFAWSPDLVTVPERQSVGLGCSLSVTDSNGAQVSQFAQPVRLEIPLSAADLSQVRRETLALYWLDAAGETWQALPTFIDEANQLAFAETNRPGHCTLLAQPIANEATPVSTIVVTGATGIDDAWYDTVTVALESNPAAAQMEYSLDAGTTWQPYSAPFTLAAAGEPLPPRLEPVEDFGSGPSRFLVLAVAMDAAGNRQNPPTARAIVIDPAKDPEAVPEPTITPLPETATGCEPQITVLAEFGVNVRGGPGLDYAIMATLPQGQTAPVIGRTQTSKWWRLGLNTGRSAEYWVSDDVVETTCIDEIPVVPAPPLPTAVPTETPTPTPTLKPTLTPTPTPTATPTGEPDVLPPTVSVLHAPIAPDETQTVAFTAQAADRGGVARLEIWVQAPGEAGLVRRKVCEDVTVCVYQGGPYAAGAGSYQAFAWDGAENQGVTAVLPFTVLSLAYP